MGELILKVGSYAGAISIIIALLSLIIKPIRKRIIGWIKKISNSQEQDKLLKEVRDSLKNFNDKSELQGEGLLSLLRDRITEKYYIYSELGYIPSYELENVLKMYTIYHRMHGNTYVDTIVEVMKGLRITPPDVAHTDL
jgi:hypothetical protein